nr:Uncharacterised protein [Salmonella sp. NCTC 7297]
MSIGLRRQSLSVQTNRHPGTILNRLLYDGLINVRLVGDSQDTLIKRDRHRFLTFKLCFRR